VLGAAGLDAAAQADAYDRLLAGEDLSTLPLVSAELAPALRLLTAVDGTGTGYLENLRAALLAAVPSAAEPIEQLAAATRALDAAGSAYRIVPGTARNFEYYTGLTFRVLSGETECIGGGRYDGLGEAIGGKPVPASGFGADVLLLADLAAATGSAAQ
jgi:histidyl-tRNA synthetase